MRKTRFFTHTSSLCALFILGNAVIILPTANADEFTFLGYLTAVLGSLILYFALLPIARKLFSQEILTSKSKIKKAGLCFVYIIASVFSLWCAADTFLSFTDFVKAVILPDTPAFFIIFIFAAICLFFASRRQEDVLKFFLIAFWFVLAVILFFFIATSFKFNLRNIFVFELPEFKSLLYQAKPYFLNPVLPTLLLPVYYVLTFKNNRSGAVLAGLTTGFILLGLCVIGSVLLFGAAFAGELPYPYASAISTVSIGRLFSRLDGFSYFLYFACALAKITVCLFVMISSLKRINRLSKE